MDKRKTIIFTNGCFDILHIGHIQLLKKAKELGDILIVGLNSDKSIKKIKGLNRPIISEVERFIMLRSIKYVDHVKIFDELDPLNLIKEIKPDILVKGGDWSEDKIIGADFVNENGGSVVTIPFIDNYSTSNIIDKIRNERI